MKTNYYIKRKKYKKFKNPKILNVFNEPLVFSIICDKGDNNNGKLSKTVE